MDASKKDILFGVISGATAVAAILAMPVLVASPKLLFGRSLSAIAPSLFPYVTLSLIVLLSVALCIVSLVNTRLKQTGTATNSEIANGPVTPDANQTSDARQDGNWVSQASFFLLLVGYGLLLKPIGFFLSSCIVITLASILLGNRHWVQIGLLAVLAPIFLYLIATRGMLVSLPELNTIELLYAQVIEWMRGLVSS